MLRGDVGQADFSGGIHRDPDAPANTVYDAVNAIVGDQDPASLMKRGATEYVTTSDAGEALLGLATLNLPTLGDVTIAWGADTYRVNGTGWTSIFGSDAPKPLARWAGVGNFWIAPSAGTGTAVVTYDGTTVATTNYAPSGVASVTAVGSVGTVARLLLGDGHKVWFSDPGDHLTIGTSSFHELPGRAQVIGFDSLGDTAIVFTTNGVFTIANMDFDPVDDAGNVQHSVALATKDVVLWGDAGIAAFGGALIVPGVDDVSIFAPGAAPATISDPIRPLYRSYVKAGHKPGQAYVYRGHYLLPIVNSSNAIVDTLVCRLDLGRPAWTRWDGHAGCIAYAVLVGSSSARQPKLYAISGQRVIDCSACLVPSGSTDANSAEPPTMTVTTRYVRLGVRARTVKRLTLRHLSTGDNSPVVLAAGVDGGSITSVTDPEGYSGTATEQHTTWPVGRKGRRVQFTFTTTADCTVCTLYGFSLKVRESGRS